MSSSSSSPSREATTTAVGIVETLSSKEVQLLRVEECKAEQFSVLPRWGGSVDGG